MLNASMAAMVRVIMVVGSGFRRASVRTAQIACYRYCRRSSHFGANTIREMQSGEPLWNSAGQSEDSVT